MRKLLIILIMLFALPAFAADFAPVWKYTILPHEGGYSNNRHDPGNWTGGKEGKGRMLGTKYGIAASVYGESLLKQGLIIKHLTPDQARRIYERDYWKRFHLDKLASQGIARELCDELVNMGGGGGESLLRWVWLETEWATRQKIPVAPKFTPATIAWINEYTRTRERRIAFYNSVKMKRIKFYSELVRKRPVMRQFFYSWVDRSLD